MRNRKQFPRSFWPRIHVDFNTPAPFTVLVEGDPVMLVDGDGNECEAVIGELREPRRLGFSNAVTRSSANRAVVVEAIADFSTWTDGPAPPASGGADD